MFEVLSPIERDRLAGKLGHAAASCRDEYAALCRLQDQVSPSAWAMVRTDYAMPAEGPGAWLGAAADAVFVAAEVSGATPGPSVYWSR
jgi:hypothetical protein